jgi:hypothetical protein
MNPQEKAQFFDHQLDVTKQSFPTDSEEVRVAKQNYERALKELFDSKRAN